jgi:glycosyltransferase involved in cell wall biosynthesis
MRSEQPVDVLIVSLGSTAGLRTADAELHDSLARAGARVALARALAPTPARTLMLTDLGWARAARTAAEGLLRQMRRSPPRALLYSSTTAALFWPRPGAIRFDAPATGNRRGHHGLWQRPLERRRLGQASVVLPWSEGGLDEAPASARGGERALVLPVPVEPSGSLQPVRDIAAITYAANPTKKGLDRVLDAWRAMRGELAGGPEEYGPNGFDGLVVAGISARELKEAGFDLEHEERIRVTGALPPSEYRALVRRSRVFVCAPRREDYGIAQLEALADGCMLVSTPAPGPYAALPIARELDPRLISDELQDALRTALTEPLSGYAQRAREALAPFSRAAVDGIVAQQLLTRLLA